MCIRVIAPKPSRLISTQRTIECFIVISCYRFIVYRSIVFYFFCFIVLSFYRFIVFLFYRFIVLSFYRFIFFLFYRFIVLSFYRFIVLLFYRFIVLLSHDLKSMVTTFIHTTQRFDVLHFECREGGGYSLGSPLPSCAAHPRLVWQSNRAWCQACRKPVWAPASMLESDPLSVLEREGEGCGKACEHRNRHLPHDAKTVCTTPVSHLCISVYVGLGSFVPDLE